MKKQITIDGVTYESIKDFCDSTDTHISCLRQYAKYHNISFEEACSAYKKGVVNKRTQCEFEINGKQFNSFSGACRYYGFYVAKVLRYASANNIDKIEALRVFVKHYNRPNGYSKNETTKFVIIPSIKLAALYA